MRGGAEVPLSGPVRHSKRLTGLGRVASAPVVVDWLQGHWQPVRGIHNNEKGKQHD